MARRSEISILKRNILAVFSLAFKVSWVGCTYIWARKPDTTTPNPARISTEIIAEESPMEGDSMRIALGQDASKQRKQKGFGCCELSRSIAGETPFSQG
jgi:hypothetical protein